MNAPVGRFAPSPTGPLHFGSLISTLGSYLEAKSRGGRWLVRIEGINRPRCRPEYADAILATLEAYGFEWDGAVMVQSARGARYRAVLELLKRQGAVFPCGCTRAELALAPPGIDGAPGLPRHLPRGAAARQAHAPSDCVLRASSNSSTSGRAHGFRISHARRATACRCAPTGCSPILSPWWSMTPSRASITSCAAPSRPRRLLGLGARTLAAGARAARLVASHRGEPVIVSDRQ